MAKTPQSTYDQPLKTKKEKEKMKKNENLFLKQNSN